MMARDLLDLTLVIDDCLFFREGYTGLESPQRRRPARLGASGRGASRF